MRAGELLVLCGPSGGGKSTLLRLLQGIVPQRTGGDLAGEVTVLDRDATATPPHTLAAAGATILYQNPLEGFVADRVEDEVAFGPESLGLSPVEIAARVADALADARMLEVRGRALGTLSGGEQQRVALAAALALRPRLLLLDEPTAHLDEATAIDVLALVDRIRRERGMAVVLAEHRLGVAASLADRVAIVVDGALRAAGRPRIVLADPALPLLGVPVPRAAQAAVRLGLGGDLPLTATELAARIRPAERAIPSSGPRPVTSEAAVRLEGTGFRYPQASGDALSDATLAIGRGERVAIVGPSGAGKSTLARIAAGLRRPTAGHVEILGLRDPALAAVAGRVALLVQNPLRQLLADTVEREIAIGLRGLGPRAARARVDGLLERFDLVGVRGRHPLLLSEGQRRRVTLAAVLARRPELLVMDEPTLAQDEAQRAALAELLRDLASTGTAILAVTHDREFANDACDRAVALRAGRIVADLELGGDAASARALASAGVPLADIPATVVALDARGDRVAARSVDDLVAAVR